MIGLYRRHFARIRQPVSDRAIARGQLTAAQQVERIRAHLGRRRAAGGLRPLPARPRLFSAVRNVNWEQAGLVDSWRPLADVVHYDWGDRYEQAGGDWFRHGRPAFGRELLERVRAAHAERPLDIFFSYLSGRWVDRTVIERIAALGILTVNYDFDDSRKFWNTRKQGVYTGSAEIAPACDVCVTAQSRANVGKYTAIGARALFLPSGGNEAVFDVPQDRDRDIGVSFIGQNYGVRAATIEHVERHGIGVHCRGVGWPLGPVSVAEMRDIYARSLITLGFGQIGGSAQVGLKGRDFEVPMTGCAYLTSWNPELAEYFTGDREILFYRNASDLVETLQRCLRDRRHTHGVGQAGRARALREHTWGARWTTLLGILG